MFTPPFDNCIETFSARMNTLDPLMEASLSTFFCSTLNYCPSHMNVFTTNDICSFNDIAYSTLHELLQYTLLTNSFLEDNPDLSYGSFFAELLVIVHWVLYHQHPFSDSTLDIKHEINDKTKNDLSQFYLNNFNIHSRIYYLFF